jgi:predicted NUDIX family NTP pyrophosphohydrolase
VREFPEVDRVGWFSVAQARSKLLKGQRAFLDRLMTIPELTGLSEGP